MTVNPEPDDHESAMNAQGRPASNLTISTPRSSLCPSSTSHRDVGPWRGLGLGMAFVCVIQGMAACSSGGGGGSDGPPPAVIIATSPAVMKNASIPLSATVVDAAPGVTWAVEGGDAYGTITQDGIYTAPATVPDGPAIIRATSTDDARGTATSSIRVIVGDDLERRPNTPVPAGGVLASTFSGGQRSVAVSGSVVYFAWGEDQSGLERVYLSVSRDRGQTLGAPVLISPLDMGDYRHPAVATDRSGGAVVVWVGTADGVEFNAYARTVALDTAGLVTLGPIQILADMGPVGDPVVTVDVDRQGIAYVAWTAEQGTALVSDTNVLVARGTLATNGTLTWSTPVPASANSGFHQIRPAIAVNDAGDLVVAWNDTRDDLLEGSNDVWWRRASIVNGAIQFLALETRANEDVTGEQVSASVAIDGTGQAAITWSDGRTTERRHVYVAQSAALDLQVSANVLVVDADGIDADQNFPSVAVDSDGGITVAFADNRKCLQNNPTGCVISDDGTGQTDIYVVRSVDGGQTFQPVPNLKVNDDPDTQIQQHGRPSVAVDDVGRAFLVWTDDRQGISLPYMARVE